MLERIKIRSMLNYMKQMQNDQDVAKINYQSFSDIMFTSQRRQHNIQTPKNQNELQFEHSFIHNPSQADNEVVKEQKQPIKSLRSYEIKKQWHPTKTKISNKLLSASSRLKDKTLTDNLQQLGIKKKKINHRQYMCSGNKLKLSILGDSHYFQQDQNSLKHKLRHSRMYSHNNCSLIQNMQNSTIQNHEIRFRLARSKPNSLGRNTTPRFHSISNNNQKPLSFRTRKNSQITPWDIRQSSFVVQE